MFDQVERLWARLTHTVGRAVVNLVDDSGPIQTAQLQFHGVPGQPGPSMIRDKVSVLHTFGISTVPPVGSEVTTLSMRGDPSNSVVVATGHRESRPRNLKPGQAVLYDEAGTTVKLTNDGKLAITCTGTLTITAVEVHVVGKITATGDITANTISLEHHIHSGVAPGAGNTGQPVP
jgi:phage gp45-like